MCLSIRILLAVMLWLGETGASAADLGLAFSANPAPAVVGKSVTYTLSVTNQSGQLLTNYTVSVGLIGDVALASSSASLGTATNTLVTATYQLPLITAGTVASLTYSGLPLSYGTVRHEILAGPSGDANQAASFTSTTISGTARLVLDFGALPGGVVVNDQVGYQLTITNRGPDTAEGVLVTNTLPSGVTFLQVNPPGLFSSISGNELRLRLGTLASGAGLLVGITVQPTSAGTFTLRANVGAPGYLNPDPSGSADSATFTATEPMAADLRTQLLSEQVYNRQTGLLEQRVGLLNGGTNAVTAARVMVAGLTNWLFNATGTNQGLPFVGYPARLNPGQSVEFVLEYFSPSRRPGPDPSLTAVGVPVPVVPSPGGSLISGVQAFAWHTNAVLLQFPATEGQQYVIRYASTPAFTNAWTIQPGVVAPGNQVQWLDQGPPATLSLPGAAGLRFYRVYSIPTP